MCLRRIPRLLSPTPAKKIKDAWREKDMYLLVESLISTIRYITCPFTEAAYTGYAGLRLTQNKATSAFIITKLSRLPDGTQEQLLAMHLKGDTSTRRGRNRTCGSNRYMQACARPDTHADKHAHRNILVWAPFPS